jgi:hypothetical protein
MFGPDMLIAPVLTDEPSRTVVFPKGTWASLWDGKPVKGPAVVNVNTPLGTTPVYLRAGAVVPMQLSRELQLGQSMTPGRVSALAVTPATSSETVSLVTDPGKAAKVTVRPGAGGCRWELASLPETSYLLVYGSSRAAKVKVDGEAVPQANGAANAPAASWRADLAGSRLLISLPPVQTGQGSSTRTIELEY